MPDPRPQLRSVQRSFWRLVREGLSIAEAAQLVGVAARTAQTWIRQAGGMPPLRLVEPVTGRFLTITDRERIAVGTHSMLRPPLEFAPRRSASSAGPRRA